MKRLKSILTVVAIFVCGMIVGGIGAGATMFNDLVKGSVRDGPENVRRALTKYAKYELRLDEDQTHQFWQILNETGAELNTAASPVRPQIEAALAKGELRLRAVLKESQRPAFENFMKTAHAKWRAALGWEPADGNVERPAPGQ